MSCWFMRTELINSREAESYACDKHDSIWGISFSVHTVIAELRLTSFRRKSGVARAQAGDNPGEQNKVDGNQWGWGDNGRNDPWKQKEVR